MILKLYKPVEKRGVNRHWMQWQVQYKYSCKKGVMPLAVLLIGKK